MKKLSPYLMNRGGIVRQRIIWIEPKEKILRVVEDSEESLKNLNVDEFLKAAANDGEELD